VGKGAVSPAGTEGRLGRPWRAARTLASFPERGPVTFLMGVMAQREAGSREGGVGRGFGGAWLRETRCGLLPHQKGKVKGRGRVKLRLTQGRLGSNAG
jgi:hypothetical protein